MDMKQIAALLGGGQKQGPSMEQQAIIQALLNSAAGVPADPQTPQLGTDIIPYSVVGGESGRIGAPITMRGGTDDPAGAAMAMGPSLSAPEMAPSPGMQPGPMAFPQAPDTFGGYDDGLRPIPHTADVPPVPSRGEQRAMQMPPDPALMGAEMDDMRMNKQSPLRQAADARRAPIMQAYGELANEFPPEMMPALEGLQINEPQIAQALAAMSPEERQQFYGVAAYNMREYGGDATAPLTAELQEWQRMSPEQRQQRTERAGEFFGREFNRDPRKGGAQPGGRTNKQAQTATLPDMNTTEGQVFGYASRAAEANSILNQFENEGTRFWQRAMGILPGNSENMLRDDEFQQYLNAEQNFLAAVLRRDTGAAITSEEFDLYRPMFFPQPGDGEPVIAQKRRLRENALASMAAGTGEGFGILPQEIQQLLQQGGATAPAPDFSTMSDEELMRALQGGN